MIYLMPILTFVGLLGLLIYLLVDFKRKKLRNIWRRATFYSFIFYLIIVSHLTIGNFTIPLQEGQINIQLIPFRFVSDWLIESNHGSWFFWNSVKLTFYNLLLLLPLGVYLALFFHYRFKKGVLIIFLTSLAIETLQLILSYVGLLFPRVFNVDDLMLNTLGGAIGMGMVYLLMKTFISRSAGMKIKQSI